MIKTTPWLCGPPPANGQYQRYPGRFEFNLRRSYPEFVSSNTLHMFSGSTEFGVTTDLRPETGADIVCPFEDVRAYVDLNYERGMLFDHVLADPPYADHWQGQWHGDLPRPKHILREASRLVKHGGLIGILHIIVIPAYRIYEVKRIGIHPIFSGPNNAMRVFNVFRKT